RPASASGCGSGFRRGFFAFGSYTFRTRGSHVSMEVIRRVAAIHAVHLGPSSIGFRLARSHLINGLWQVKCTLFEPFRSPLGIYEMASSEMEVAEGRGECVL